MMTALLGALALGCSFTNPPAGAGLIGICGEPSTVP
jgi:hypothetical protein